MKSSLEQKIRGYITQYADGKDYLYCCSYTPNIRVELKEVITGFIQMADDFLADTFGDSDYTDEEALALLFENAHKPNANFDYINEADRKDPFTQNWGEE